MPTRGSAIFPTCGAAASSICVGTLERNRSGTGTTLKPALPAANPWTRQINERRQVIQMLTPSDRILISRIACPTVIGVTAPERAAKQNLYIDVEFTTDAGRAARRDSIDD